MTTTIHSQEDLLNVIWTYYQIDSSIKQLHPDFSNGLLPENGKEFINNMDTSTPANLTLNADKSSPMYIKKIDSNHIVEDCDAFDQYYDTEVLSYRSVCMFYQLRSCKFLLYVLYYYNNQWN